MPKNAGKIFEEDIKKSIPSTCWIYRLRDNASSFSNGTNTRFTSSNICDYIMLDDLSKTLFLFELKSTKNTSMPLDMIRGNQIKGLQEARQHNLVAGFLFNFRNVDNDTFFMDINNFTAMSRSTEKKSFNIKDLENNNAVKIESTRKRTRYTYDIKSLVDMVHL